MESNLEQKFDEVLQAVGAGFSDMNERFSDIQSQLDLAKEDIHVLKQDNKIFHSTMVTKEFLSEKLADLGAEIGKRINTLSDREIAFAKKISIISQTRQDAEPGTHRSTRRNAFVAIMRHIARNTNHKTKKTRHKGCLFYSHTLCVVPRGDMIYLV